METRAVVERQVGGLFLLIFYFFNVYLFLRERQTVSGGGAESEGETQNPK